MLQKFIDKYPIGKYVQVISKKSRSHYREFGRIVGYTKSGDYIKVYFSESKSCSNFAPASLYRIN